MKLALLFLSLIWASQLSAHCFPSDTAASRSLDELAQNFTCAQVGVEGCRDMLGIGTKLGPQQAAQATLAITRTMLKSDPLVCNVPTIADSAALIRLLTSKAQARQTSKSCVPAADFVRQKPRMAIDHEISRANAALGEEMASLERQIKDLQAGGNSHPIDQLKQELNLKQNAVATAEKQLAQAQAPVTEKALRAMSRNGAFLNSIREKLAADPNSPYKDVFTALLKIDNDFDGGLSPSAVKDKFFNRMTKNVDAKILQEVSDAFDTHLEAVGGAPIVEHEALVQLRNQAERLTTQLSDLETSTSASNAERLAELARAKQVLATRQQQLAQLPLALAKEAASNREGAVSAQASLEVARRLKEITGETRAVGALEARLTTAAATEATLQKMTTRAGGYAVGQAFQRTASFIGRQGMKGLAVGAAAGAGIGSAQAGTVGFVAGVASGVAVSVVSDSSAASCIDFPHAQLFEWHNDGSGCVAEMGTPAQTVQFVSLPRDEQLAALRNEKLCQALKNYIEQSSDKRWQPRCQGGGGYTLTLRANAPHGDHEFTIVSQTVKTRTTPDGVVPQSIEVAYKRDDFGARCANFEVDDHYLPKANFAFQERYHRVNNACQETTSIKTSPPLQVASPNLAHQLLQNRNYDQSMLTASYMTDTRLHAQVGACCAGDCQSCERYGLKCPASPTDSVGAQ